MTFEGFLQILYHVGPDVHGATDDPVSDGLDSLRNSSKDSQLLATKAELSALEV